MRVSAELCLCGQNVLTFNKGTDGYQTKMNGEDILLGKQNFMFTPPQYKD